MKNKETDLSRFERYAIQNLKVVRKFERQMELHCVTPKTIEELLEALRCSKEMIESQGLNSTITDRLVEFRQRILELIAGSLNR